MQPQKYTDHVAAAVMGALHAYAEGRRSEWEEMDFSEDEIRWLSTLTTTELMRFCAACRRLIKWGGINHQAFVTQRNLFEQQRCVGEKQEALIGLDAPVSLLTRLFGLSTAEYAELRKKLKLAPRTGRPKSLTEEQQTTVWRIWKATQGQEAVDRLLAVGSAGVPLNSAWHNLSQWMDKEDADPETAHAT